MTRKDNTVSKFQKEVYVTIDPNSDGGNDLMVWRGIGDGVEDDGPTTVAIYRLVETKRISKKLEIK